MCDGCFFLQNIDTIKRKTDGDQNCKNGIVFFQKVHGLVFMHGLYFVYYRSFLFLKHQQ